VLIYWARSESFLVWRLLWDTLRSSRACPRWR
jgi:hypothetical protein